MITVATLDIGPYLNLAEVSGNIRNLTLFLNSGFIEVKIDQPRLDFLCDSIYWPSVFLLSNAGICLPAIIL
jgi:hypothetical protein